MANDLNPAAVFELLEHQGIDGHATNVFHVAARHWLTIGNDGQDFHRGARVFRRFLWVQAVQKVAHFGAALHTPATGNLHQFDATLCPVVLDVLQKCFERVGAQLIVKQLAQLAHRQRLYGA